MILDVRPQTNSTMYMEIWTIGMLTNMQPKLHVPHRSNVNTSPSEYAKFILAEDKRFEKGNQDEKSMKIVADAHKQQVFSAFV